MSLVTLHPTAGSSNFLNAPGSGFNIPGTVGSPDIATCLQAIGDGSYTVNTGSSLGSVLFDTSTIPIGATINSVQLSLLSESTAGGLPEWCPGYFLTIENPVTILLPDSFAGAWDQNPGCESFGSSYLTWTVTFPVNPYTSLAWTIANIAGVYFGFSGEEGTPGNHYYADYLALIVDYSGGGLFIWYYNPITNNYQYSFSAPGSPWQPLSPFLAAESLNPSFGSTDGGD